MTRVWTLLDLVHHLMGVHRRSAAIVAADLCAVARYQLQEVAVHTCALPRGSKPSRK
ncbi:hypothetical protein AB0G54_24965 [Streptomyces yokosukanensis]|uniref:hypothetical protein n=1 Tax=Streptomyces yokosukanensis TaxID=67386 RepID=UPI000A4A45F4|nr:hypothetical protein [Streptomyces yokosukanensis]